MQLEVDGNLVRRTVDWASRRFLYKIVREGFKAGDEGWKGLWTKFCKEEMVPGDKMNPKKMKLEGREEEMDVLTI